jgi:hypothetical protein
MGTKIHRAWVKRDENLREDVMAYTLAYYEKLVVCGVWWKRMKDVRP